MGWLDGRLDGRVVGWVGTYTFIGCLGSAMSSVGVETRAVPSQVIGVSSGPLAVGFPLMGETAPELSGDRSHDRASD